MSFDDHGDEATDQEISNSAWDGPRYIPREDAVEERLDKIEARLTTISQVVGDRLAGLDERIREQARGLCHVINNHESHVKGTQDLSDALNSLIRSWMTLSEWMQNLTNWIAETSGMNPSEVDAQVRAGHLSQPTVSENAA